MRTINKIFQLSGVAVLVALGTGCVKEDPSVDIDTGARILELRGPAAGAFGQIFDFRTTDTTIRLVTANLAADQPAPEDIKLTFVVDNQVITDYNTRSGESLEPLEPARYSFPTMEATIPAGKREVELKATFKDPTYFEGKSKAVGIRIASSSNPGYIISQNFGKQVLPLRVKNKYHGVYKATGVFTHPTAGPRDIDEDKELITVTPTSVRAPLGDLGGSDYFMILDVNPVTNKVTITKSGVTPNIVYYGTAADNVYDPATRTFKLHYAYTGGGGDRVIKENIKYDH